MLNVSRGAIPAAGRGAVIAALVAVMGYGVGLTQSSHATVSAQTPLLLRMWKPTRRLSEFRPESWNPARNTESNTSHEHLSTDVTILREVF